MPDVAVSYDFCVEWDWTAIGGPVYRYAMNGTRTVGGNTYEERITEIDGIGGFFIDRKNVNIPSFRMTLDNAPDNVNGPLPFHDINAIHHFEDRPVRVYLLDVWANTFVGGAPIYTGLTGRPEFRGEGYTCDISATHPLDSSEMMIPANRLTKGCVRAFGGSTYDTAGGSVPSVGCPYATYGIPGFTSCDYTFASCEERGMQSFYAGFRHIAPVLNDDRNNLVDRDKVRASGVPIVLGDGDMIVRAETYRAVIRDSELIVDFLVSSVHPGLPFDASQIDASRVRLGKEQRAKWVKFWTGIENQPVPGNQTIFDDGSGHSFVAYGAARFDLTTEQKDKFSNSVPFHLTRIKLDGGRKLARSGTRSANPVYHVEDILRDRLNGPGIPSGMVGSITPAANYVGTRFQWRTELDVPTRMTDLLRDMLGSYGGYLTFDNLKLEFGAKQGSDSPEAPVATFGTGGIELLANPDWHEEDFKELDNEIEFSWRTKHRQKDSATYFDKGAQISAGNGLEKKVGAEVFLYGVYDALEGRIAAAIWMREEQNLNATVAIQVDAYDFFTSGVKTGKIIRINSDHITNNGSNYLFRVTDWELNQKDWSVSVMTRVYKPIVYDYNDLPIGSDILRDGNDTGVSTRPPDVENCAAVIVDFDTADDDSRMVKIHCTWDYPDLTAWLAELAAEGTKAEYPIEAVKLYWRYTDESIHDLHEGPRVQRVANQTTGVGDLLVPFHKRKIVEVWFVAIGRNNGIGRLTYEIDPTKTTYLDDDIDSVEFAFDVGDTGVLSVSDLVLCEGEVMLVSAVSGHSITVQNDGTARDPQDGTESVGHLEGTEIGVAKKSHPTVDVDMRVRRHTLPVVQNVRARRREKGVQVKYDDVYTDPGENEVYFIYWTLDPTLLADGSAFVTGFAAGTVDPKVPPTGIFFIKNKDLDRIIHYEDIDAAFGSDASDQPIYIRVTAKIKNNYSSALSTLANQRHGNKPLNPPSTPFGVSGTRTTDLEFEVTPGSDRVRCIFTLGAKEETPFVQTFDESDMTQISPVLQKWVKATSSWQTKKKRAWETVEDSATASQTVEVMLHRGSKWRWVRNVARNGGSKSAKSPDVNVEFIVGQVTDEIAGITDLSIAAFGTNEDTNSIEVNAKDSDLLLLFTQPATPVALDYYQVQKKKHSATRWRNAAKESLTDDSDDADIQTTGAKKIRVPVTHAANAKMDYRARLVAADGSKSSWATLSHDSSAGDSDTTIVPPPVTTVTVALGEVGPESGTDDDGREIKLVCGWTYDQAAVTSGIAAGTWAADPYRKVKLYWRYQDDATDSWREGKTAAYTAGQTTATAKFAIPFHGSRTAVVAFVAVGPGGGRLEPISAAPQASIALGTNHYTYPVVTGLSVVSRRHGVHSAWLAVNRDMVEKYLHYWTLGPGLVTNNPAWYLATPLSPATVSVLTYASDSFTRANGALGTSSGGQTWVSPLGAIQVAGNAASPTTTAESISYIDSGHSTVKVTAKLTHTATFGSGQQAGLMIRYVDATHSFWVLYSAADDQIQFWSRTGGAATFLQTVSGITISSGDIVGFTDDGVILQVLVNGAVVHTTSYFDVAPATKQGIYTKNTTGAAFDDYLVESFVSLYSPAATPIFSDLFNVAGAAAAPWVVGSGTWAASSGLMQETAFGGGSLLYDAGIADVVASVTIGTPLGSQNAGVIIRGSSDSDYFAAVVRTGDFTLRLFDHPSGGTFNTVAVIGGVVPVAGDVITAVAVGEVILVYYNGVLKLNYRATSRLTNTKVGLFAEAQTQTFRDFSVTKAYDPPQTVYCVELKGLQYTIPYEDILAAGGAEGSTVNVRIAAAVKHNYSTTLSALGSSYDTHRPLYAPSTPAAGLWSTALEGDVGTGHATLTFQVFFSEADNTKTGAQDAARTIRIDYTDTTTGKTHIKTVKVKDPSATSVTATVRARAGHTYTWNLNTALNDLGEKSSATPGSVTLVAGVVASDVTKITAFTIASVTFDTNNMVTLVCTYTNDATTPAIVKKITIRDKKTSGGTYKTRYVERLQDTPSASTAGAKTVTIQIPHAYHKTALTFEATLEVDGGGTVVATSTGTSPGATPGAPTLDHAHIGQHGLTVDWIRTAGNFKHHRVEMQFAADSGGVTVVDPRTGAASPGLTVSSGHQYHTGLSKHELKANGYTALYVKGRYIGANEDDNTDDPGTYSAFLAVTFKQKKEEDDTQIPPKVGNNRGKNLVRGGKMLHGANDYKDSSGLPIGTGSQLGKHWFLTASTSGTRIDDTALSGALGIRWNKTFGWLEISTDAATNGQSVNTKIAKAHLRNEKITLSLPLMGSTGFSPGSFDIGIWDEGAAAWIDHVTRSLTLTTAAQVLKEVFTIPSGYVMNGAILLRVVPPNWATASMIYTTKWMLVNGNREALFSEAEEDESADSPLTISVDNGFGAIGATNGDSGVAAGSWIDFG
jgi:hypothetical protein